MKIAFISDQGKSGYYVSSECGFVGFNMDYFYEIGSILELGENNKRLTVFEDGGDGVPYSKSDSLSR
jgi:hypothetical protein